MRPANLSSSSALVGRDDELRRIVESAAPLVVVTGEAGIGRSSVLAAARERLADQGVTTITSRGARNERTRPYAVLSRLSAQLTAADDRPPASRPAPVAGQLADALSRATANHQRLAVFLDDLQWIDAGSLATLVPMVRTLVGSPITFVVALRSRMADSKAGRDALAGLVEDGLAEVIPLRPLRRAEVDALVTATLAARPGDTLSESLHRSCRGVPAAVLAAIDGHRRTGSLRIVQRHAYLAWPGKPPQPATDLPMFEDLRQLGEPAWPVVKALAVLHPLGDAATRLIAEAVGLSEAEVIEVLAGLRDEGVLRPGGRPRFRLPLLADSLAVCLGPYERRRLAQIAVTAIWTDGVEADPRYLAEQLVTAGKLVDPPRAVNELLAQGAMLDNGYFAERWLRAAVDLITDRGQRAWALFMHAAACCVHLRFAEAVDSASAVFAGHADLLPPEIVLELEMIYVVALFGSADIEALTAIVDEGWRTLPGGEGHRIVTRAAALCHLDRWREADEQLRSTREIWRDDNDAVAAFGLIFSTGTTSFLGRMAELRSAVADPAQRPLWDVERHRQEQLVELGWNLMTFGELDRSEALFAAHDLPAERRSLDNQVISAALAGRWDHALDVARVSLATGSSLGYAAAHTVMCREMSIILTARGRLAEARTVIENAQARGPMLLHLLSVPESDLEHALGAAERARRLVLDGIGLAVEGGLVVGTDELWLRMTEWHLAAGKATEARECAAEVIRIADLLDTGRARLHGFLATAIADRDGRAAAEAVSLARQRDQPFELANALSLLAGRELVEGKLLREAYELYDELDALLPRARLRQVMRDLDIAVPGRSATVAENERLLAALVTEGLTNRELAVVLGGSEKSVEGRLTRLFQRTGYRSRVELAAAMLTGEYPA
ncbi:AAA family ATPase [Kutzneria sp. CA-103260]|uniref:AAA family ATPase n=1 Tax=Kutzneria sp. CA-103260 TaxID=2802641 RepID=UPI001BA53ADD|nr:LuxR family transcriptional regulator [Kutzneria sp. CA-103260]QUQ68322.1 AAA ATPase domain protein [Kutzneria sp. CA-103260]